MAEIIRYSWNFFKSLSFQLPVQTLTFLKIKNWIKSIRFVAIRTLIWAKQACKNTPSHPLSPYKLSAMFGENLEICLPQMAKMLLIIGAKLHFNWSASLKKTRTCTQKQLSYYAPSTVWEILAKMRRFVAWLSAQMHR